MSVTQNAVCNCEIKSILIYLLTYIQRDTIHIHVQARSTSHTSVHIHVCLQIGKDICTQANRHANMQTYFLTGTVCTCILAYSIAAYHFYVQWFLAFNEELWCALTKRNQCDQWWGCNRPAYTRNSKYLHRSFFYHISSINFYSANPERRLARSIELETRVFQREREDRPSDRCDVSMPMQGV